MSRILVIGNGPLPHQNQVHAHNAASFRTYFFMKVLKEAGHDVSLALIDLGNSLPATPTQFNARSFNKEDPNLLQKIHRIIGEFRPSALVGVNTFPSFVAARLKSQLPLWCDLNGWVMAEAQSQAGVVKSNALIPHYFNLEKTVIQRADRFSVVSNPQKYALIGELATVGRLNQQNNGEPLVYVTPNYFEALLPTPPRSRPAHDKAFRVLWCGGYNTWVDENTLFKGLEHAMRHDPDIEFVSTGGTIEGLDNITFKRFKEKIDQSPLKKRFTFLGWVAHEKLPQLFADADVGLNVDVANYESEIGARNRLNEMLVRGLPIITSLNAEITHDLKNSNVAEVFSAGDWEAFGNAILRLKKNPTLRHEYAERGQKFAKSHYDYPIHTQALCEWCRSPKRAKDAGMHVSMKKMNPIKAIVFSLKNDGLGKTVSRIWKRIVRR